jgi:hypothetical protein
MASGKPHYSTLLDKDEILSDEMKGTDMTYLLKSGGGAQRDRRLELNELTNWLNMVLRLNTDNLADGSITNEKIADKAVAFANLADSLKERLILPVEFNRNITHNGIFDLTAIPDYEKYKIIYIYSPNTRVDYGSMPIYEQLDYTIKIDKYPSPYRNVKIILDLAYINNPVYQDGNQTGLLYGTVQIFIDPGLGAAKPLNKIVIDPSVRPYGERLRCEIDFNRSSGGATANHLLVNYPELQEEEVQAVNMKHGLITGWAEELSFKPGTVDIYGVENVEATQFNIPQFPLPPSGESRETQPISILKLIKAHIDETGDTPQGSIVRLDIPSYFNGLLYIPYGAGGKTASGVQRQFRLYNNMSKKNFFYADKNWGWYDCATNSFLSGAALAHNEIFDTSSSVSNDDLLADMEHGTVMIANDKSGGMSIGELCVLTQTVGYDVQATRHPQGEWRVLSRVFAGEQDMQNPANNSVTVIVLVVKVSTNIYR